MKRKIVICLLIVISFFLLNNKVNASTIDYELTIENNRLFHERITYKIEKNTTNTHLLSVINSNVYFDINNRVPYKKTISRENNTVIVTLTHKYKSSEINKSKLLNECFKNYSFEEDSYGIIYYGESPFLCNQNADNINITVKTDINVLIENADMKNNNTYIWNNITKDFMMDLSVGEYNPNSDVLPPVFNDNDIIDDSGIPEDYDGTINQFSYNAVLIIAIPCLVLGGISIILIKRKHKKRRKINNNLDYNF